MDKKTIVLLLLQDQKPRYGLELVSESEGLLKRGTVYVLLDRMEDAGLIKSRVRPPRNGEQGPPRRIYRITGKGVKHLAETRARKPFFAKILGLTPTQHLGGTP